MSGEVPIPSDEYVRSGASMAVRANVEWTFPLDFVEVVTGEGERITTWTAQATELPPFGSHAFEIPFDGTGQAWGRFAAWDSVRNGAMTTPLRLE